MMHSTRKRRLWFVLILLLGSGLIVSLILYALKQNINLFYTPSQIISGEAALQHRIRIGGMVEKNTLERGNHLEVSFFVTDFKEKIKVEYKGILPDLFKEGQGIVATGQLKPNCVFVADEILAKHDENYMPPEVANMLEDGVNEVKAGQ